MSTLEIPVEQPPEEVILQEALDFIVGSESFVPYPYDDWYGADGRLYSPDDHVRGTATIGFGDTSPEVINRYWNRLMTYEEAVATFFERASRDYYRPMVLMLDVSLNINQLVALLSFVWNVGVGGFQKSSLRRVVNALAFDQVEGAFLMWQTGNKTGDLRERRLTEIEKFFTPWDGPTREDDDTELLAVIDG